MQKRTHNGRNAIKRRIKIVTLVFPISFSLSFSAFAISSSLLITGSGKNFDANLFWCFAKTDVKNFCIK